MTFGIVAAIALSGLGCHNLDSETTPASHTHLASPQSVASAPGAATWLSGQHHHHNHGQFPPMAHRHGTDALSDHDMGGRLHATLYSFVFGHDPDVPTVAEIESTLDSGGYGPGIFDGYPR